MSKMREILTGSISINVALQEDGLLDVCICNQYLTWRHHIENATAEDASALITECIKATVARVEEGLLTKNVIRRLIAMNEIELTDMWVNIEADETQLYYKVPMDLIPQEYLENVQIPDGARIVHGDLQLCFSGKEVRADRLSEILIGPVASHEEDGLEMLETLDVNRFELSDKDIDSLIRLYYKNNA